MLEVNIDGEPITTVVEGDTRVTVVGPEVDVESEEDVRKPLAWLNKAEIVVDPERDDVTVSITAADEAYAFSIHRVNDPEHENYGRLVLIMPYPSEAGRHKPMKQIAAGGYMLG